MNSPHTVHNNTRESPRYIFTIIIFLIKNFKSSITPLIFIFITYYYFAPQKTLVLKQTSYIYIL